MANLGSRSWQVIVCLWLFTWMFPAGAAVVAHYEECSGQGETWSFPAIEAAGHTPKLLTDLTRDDLDGVDVLFVTNCSLITHFDEFKSRLPDIHAAINNGLVFVMHDRNVSLAASVMPGVGALLQYVWNPTTDTQVQDDSTLVTHGPAGVVDNSTLDGGWAASHGYVDANTFPAGVSSILSQTEANRSVLFHYAQGLGHVVYSTMPLDHFLRFTPYCDRYVDPIKSLCLQSAYIYTPNVIAYSAQLAQRAPVARVSADVTISEGQSTLLNGAASFDPQNSSLTYAWTQLSPVEPNNLLNNTTAVAPTFYAPYLTDNQVITYQLIVTNARGLSSEPAYVNVTVKNSNTPPVADAGNDRTVKAGATVMLDASRSYDPDNDPELTYQWTQVEGPGVVLSNRNAMAPGFEVPAAVGQSLAFELQVSDGKETSIADIVRITIVDNAPPVADAGSDMVKDEASIVVLDGQQSHDPDDDSIEYSWQQVSGVPVTLERSLSAAPTFKAPTVSAGGTDLVFSLTVTDTDRINPKSAIDHIVIHVRNSNDPPRCDLAQPSSELLWPPNHKMVEVMINGITDEDSLYNQVSLTVTGITQDEPVAGRGDGFTSPDGVIPQTGANNTALLRAERNGKGNGRVYQVNFEASDGLETCSGSVVVGVPVSRKHHREKHLKFKGHRYDKEYSPRHHRHNHKTQWLPVDDGQNYDATEKVLRHKVHEAHDGHQDDGLKDVLKSFLYKLHDRGQQHEKKTNKSADRNEKKSVSKKQR